jgi:DNA repair exonuclease SbcCD nuclease subunit
MATSSTTVPPTRAFIIGDPHFQLTNIQDVECAIRETIKLVKSLKPDFVVILGDILHTHNIVYTQAYKLACMWIETLSKECKVFVVIGNHDYINQTQFLSDNHIFGALKRWPNVVIVDHVVAETYNTQLFVFCPYVEPGLFIDALSTYPDWHDATCVFGHQEFLGVKMGGIESKHGDVWNPEYPPVITGHIHEAQDVYPNIYYPGSMMQHAQGDHTKKFVWLTIFYGDDKIFDRMKYILRGIKPRKTIQCSIASLSTIDLDRINRECYLRLVLKGSLEEKKAFMKTSLYKHMKSHNISVHFKTNKHTNHNERITMSRRKKTFHTILSEIIKDKDETTQRIYEELLSKNILNT